MAIVMSVLLCSKIILNVVNLSRIDLMIIDNDRRNMEDGKVIVKEGKISEEMNVLVSGMLHKEDKTFVRVSFLRGQDWAEGIVPDGVIEKSEGFTKEEIGKLEDYLAGDKEQIIKQAKGVNPVRKLFGI